MAGRIEVRTALSIIRLARRRADKVRQLLEKLGNHDDRSPLSQRFRRVAKRMNHTQLDDGKGDLFGELTLAFHDLNLLLNEAFYPGAAAERLSG